MDITKQQSQDTSPIKSLRFSQNYPNFYLFTKNWLFSILASVLKYMDYPPGKYGLWNQRIYLKWIIPDSLFLPLKDLIRNHLFQKLDHRNESELKNILGINFIAPLSVNLVNMIWLIIKERYGWNQHFGTNLKYQLKIAKRKCVQTGGNILLYKFGAMKLILNGSAALMGNKILHSLVFCLFDTIQQFIPQTAKLLVLPNVMIGALLELLTFPIKVGLISLSHKRRILRSNFSNADESKFIFRFYSNSYSQIVRQLKNQNKWINYHPKTLPFIKSLKFGIALSLYEMLKNLSHDQQSKQ